MNPTVTDAPSQEFSQRTPEQVGRFLDAKLNELERLQSQVEAAHNTAEDAEIAWVKHYDKVIEDLEGEGEKLPGEEKCVGIARRRGGWDKWSTWRRAERQVKKIEKRATVIGNQVSAAQTEANLLKAVA